VNFTTDVVPGAAPGNRTYDVNLAFSQAFNGGSMGLERFEAFSYIGQRPSYYQTSAGTQLVGLGNGPFYRVGFAGDLFLKKLELLPLFMHGHDNVYLGNSTPSNQPLPSGAQAPSFNGGFLEAHYYVNPQLVFLGRFEKINVGTQANSANPSDYGNVTAYAVGYRWYPIMFSRAGLAFHNEYAISKSIGIVPLSGDGTGLPPLPLPNSQNVWSSSLLIGFDFAF
jgi:hypothetical protein